MTTQQLITLVAQTALHAGAGSSNGYIDLPIQREIHTDWPCVYGSGVKGALRAAATLTAGLGPDSGASPNPMHRQVIDLFGPETGAANLPGADGGGAGALVVTDARLLLLPVRSLTGHWRWVTCPALLRRLVQDATRLGFAATQTEAITTLTSAATAASAGLADDAVWLANALSGGLLYLDDLNFAASANPALSAACQALAELTTIAPDELTARTALVSDDRFAYLARYATAVNTHVKLNDKKSVVAGALWTEESLPPETVLYVGAHLAPRGGRVSSDFCTLKALSFPRGYLQIGGNETVGMGFCQVHTVSPAAAGGAQ